MAHLETHEYGHWAKTRANITIAFARWVAVVPTTPTAESKPERIIPALRVPSALVVNPPLRPSASATSPKIDDNFREMSGEKTYQ